ncbi:hypothetical protein [uncultured Tenacibaculum sp.]|uniref:hypothetical protein n=1 Tax=uncultured Tenacibaculum sp. TaxID=174713 RepID=UPI00262EBCDE|nr:hypothetical protein [uncultured Tenacibaculum sp.]
MKNTIYTLLFLLILIGCNQSKEKRIVIESSFNDPIDLTFDTIFDLNTYKTLGEFREARNKTIKKHEFAFLTSLFIDDHEYVINLESIRDRCSSIYPLKNKNTLYIYKDSIVKPFAYQYAKEVHAIHKLKEVYEKDVLNYNKIKNYSTSPRDLVLSFEFEDSITMQSFKQVLHQVVKSYLETNAKVKDTLPLNISLDNIRRLTPVYED